jgi:ATP-dependent Clp protease adapter protein ClpS
MTKGKELPKFSVVLANDDKNSADKVIACLVNLVGKSLMEAVTLTGLVHNFGAAKIGIYHYELAETLVARLNEAGLTTILARETHPEYFGGLSGQNPGPTPENNQEPDLGLEGPENPEE